MIIVKDLIKKFGDNKNEYLILNKINFEISKNEFVSILGPVGCGKTTLLNIIGGLEKPTSGSVFIDGEEVMGPRTDICIIFQNSLLFPWKSVWENVKVSITNEAKTKDDINHLLKKSLEKAGMLEFAHMYPKQLSGGMKQKTAFARILASNYKILLMDEPFSNLDAQTRILMEEELLKIRQALTSTILFVTHNIEEAILLSDKIILLSKSPTQVLEIINIDLPNSRNQEMKSWVRFNKIRDKIWEIIKKEII